ncbi:MAG: hypothetical protein PPHEMADM_5243 [uncultured Paraburkholderia sp.]|nr:MAG: hypothetical protein PPHEINF_4041 [uncultured Paraburkholderia sp.]CAH2798087.1 MAG: hypothetical protein PPHEESC_4213 [uncultured Paraburkholderia sp.]CAH2904152.1 MAG: hypothetical protein PPHEMADE_5231 [uncultured Paraburkholderia sp.]CAH2932356.1 MAG: hypothetical protein PPHEMADMSA_4021 [uncultured Paraburkholderia sp.]CAH2933909.1 MAG: hypothetical protein PPHERAN_4099 [uncultured Paraburkholderia sp.]
MKVLKIVLIACCFSAAAAHAQTTQAPSQQQVSQANDQRANSAATSTRTATPARQTDECVGPVSYCNLFFGS